MRQILVFVVVVRFALSYSGASADTITTYSDFNTFQSALISLALPAAVINFESHPDGTPVPATDFSAASPLSYPIFTSGNTATFSTGSSFVYEDFASRSPSHSLREIMSGPVNLSYARPVAAIGAFALDIDNLVAAAASAVYHSTNLPDRIQLFNNTGGIGNEFAFFGAIATNDSMTQPVNILTGSTFDQSNVGTTEFTYLDDVFTASVPEPTTSALVTLACLLFGLRNRSDLAMQRGS